MGFITMKGMAGGLLRNARLLRLARQGVVPFGAYRAWMN